jgi:N-acetylglucosaminyl-diphospho-decaprenol L-rhamnosyltransferase
MLDCSIIIISYNVRDLLRDCLTSIIQSAVALNTAHSNLPTVEILVIDSASQDDSVAMIQREFPQVRLFAHRDNIGYTKGNNIGLAQAQGRNVFLLNPDTVLMGDALPQLIRYLDENPAIGIVGPYTLNTDGTTQSSRRRFPTRLIAFFESTWLQPYAPQNMLKQFYVQDAPETASMVVDWVQGSALMAKRAVYEQIGGLDEGYIMYSEELDWCKRAKNANWGVFFLGTAHIIHHGGKSSEQVGAMKHIYFQQSKLRYYRKYHGRAFALGLRLFLLCGYLWQIALEFGKSVLGNQKSMRQERIRAYWQVIRSGLSVS